jgi:hypothetical protein
VDILVRYLLPRDWCKFWFDKGRNSHFGQWKFNIFVDYFRVDKEIDKVILLYKLDWKIIEDGDGNGNGICNRNGVGIGGGE